MLCDGRSGIRFDSDGLPTRLDDEVFADMDAWGYSFREGSARPALQVGGRFFHP